jgi:hypothetical protein
MDAEGELNTILIAQKQRKVCHKEKTDGTDYEIDHRLNQSPFIFCPSKKEDNDND